MFQAIQLLSNLSNLSKKDLPKYELSIPDYNIHLTNKEKYNYTMYYIGGGVVVLSSYLIYKQMKNEEKNK